MSSVFKDGGNIETQSKIFLKRLGYCLSVCFNKIRVKKNKRNSEIEGLFQKRRILKTKKDEKSHEELQNIETKLAEMCAEDNSKLIKDACEGCGVNAGKLWKLKQESKLPTDATQ